jgi:hypothetical protein
MMMSNMNCDEAIALPNIFYGTSASVRTACRKLFSSMLNDKNDVVSRMLKDTTPVHDIPMIAAQRPFTKPHKSSLQAWRTYIIKEVINEFAYDCLHHSSHDANKFHNLMLQCMDSFWFLLGMSNFSEDATVRIYCPRISREKQEQAILEYLNKYLKWLDDLSKIQAKCSHYSLPMTTIWYGDIIICLHMLGYQVENVIEFFKPATSYNNLMDTLIKYSFIKEPLDSTE